MKFEFLAVAGLFDTRKKMVRRPMLPLILKDKNGNDFEVFSVIDSGADTTTLNIEYASVLGIKLERKKEIIGIGNDKVPVYEGVFPFSIKHMNISLTVPAWYVDSQNVDILLGRETFFESFKIKFEKDHNTFELIQVRRP